VPYYTVIDNIVKLSGGYGSSGENFGAILIEDNPLIIIGCSGQDFVKNLKNYQSEKSFSKAKLFLPSLTINEVVNLWYIEKEFPEIEIIVHSDIYQSLTQPRLNFLENRFYLSKDKKKDLQKKFPKQLKNLKPITKKESLQADKTKILIIPFSGPHEGHFFLYSVTHKLLYSGIFLNLTPSDTGKFYLDMTGSLDQYKKGLEFIEQAQTEIHATAYDEPVFTRGNKISTIQIKSAIKQIEENVIEICRNEKPFASIVDEYLTIYSDQIGKPYNEYNHEATILRKVVSELINRSILVENNNIIKMK
jgi:hypothetical protein